MARSSLFICRLFYLSSMIILDSKFKVLSTKYHAAYFFRDKTFFFVKIESWNFKHLYDLEFRKISQNSDNSVSNIKEVQGSM